MNLNNKKADNLYISFFLFLIMYCNRLCIIIELFKRDGTILLLFLKYSNQ